MDNWGPISPHDVTLFLLLRSVLTTWEELLPEDDRMPPEARLLLGQVLLAGRGAHLLRDRGGVTQPTLRELLLELEVSQQPASGVWSARRITTSPASSPPPARRPTPLAAHPPASPAQRRVRPPMRRVSTPRSRPTLVGLYNYLSYTYL